MKPKPGSTKRYKTPSYDRWWKAEPQHIRDFWDGRGVSKKVPECPISILMYDAILTRFENENGQWLYRCDAIASQFRNQKRPPGTYKIADTPSEAIEQVESVFYRQLQGRQLVRPRSLIFHDNELRRADDVPGNIIVAKVQR